MNETLRLKELGEKMNKENPGSGDALRLMGKLLGNATYGQQLKNDYDTVTEFIHSIKEKDQFLN